jgi:hypothetical protein
MRMRGIALACLSVLLAAPAAAELNINVGIGIPAPPAFVVSAGPAVVVVPGTPVYYAPGQSADIFFYQGFWWTPHQGYWFRAQSYNGPWVFVPGPQVPVAFVNLPPNYKQAVVQQKPIPYGQLKKHWKEWEPARASASPGKGRGKHKH